jgi:hypothetical protein
MLRKYIAGLVIAAVIAYVVSTIALVSVYSNAVVSTMASVALVVVTAALVYATFTYSEAASRQAEAMNRQAKAQEEQKEAIDRQVAALTDPVVFFGEEEFETSTISQFFVQNVGPGIAYDINFILIRDSEIPILTQNRKLSDLAFINTPIKTLAPGQKIPFGVLDPRTNFYDETIEVEVNYKNKPEAEEPFRQRFLIDFTYQKGMAQVRPPSIADNIKKIAENVKKVADS